MSTFAIILAAGKGTRMQSDLPKVMHCVGGMPMVEHLVGKLESLNVDEIFVVIGHKGEQIRDHLGTRVTYVEQHETLGTAHAVSQVAPILKDRQGETLVLTGDTPLIEKSTMKMMLKIVRNQPYEGVVLTALFNNPTGYGRVLRDKRTGEVTGIVEERDATDKQRRIREVNTGIFCFRNQSLFQALPYIDNDNAQQEYYLTDIIPALHQTLGRRTVMETLTLLDPSEVIGINTKEQLAEAETVLYNRKLKQSRVGS